MRDQPWDDARQHRRCNDEKQRGTQDCCDLRHASPLMLSKRRVGKAAPEFRWLHPFTNHDEVVALPAVRKAGVVMHPSCLLVSRVGGPEKLTRERFDEFGDGFGDRWYRRHSVLSFLAPNVFHLAAEEANAKNSTEDEP